MAIPRGKKATAPRIADRSAEWYKSTFGSINGGLEYVLDATPQLYRLTLHNLKGKFSRGELMLMLDSGNGTLLTAGLAGQHLGLGVSDSIALDGLDAKWEIDGAELNAKVAALTIFEAACLELWVQAFWTAAAEENQDVEAYVREMA